ncbi:MAG: 30S ribosomal protein S9 [Candidatus Thermoplasmatota archaeon]|nr:30S ribosomal protein S9 [Candidatus Thermoplasmatota archaeon]
MKERCIITTGKRKTAIARARVKKGKGRIRINNIPLEIWPGELPRLKMMEPIILAKGKAESLDVDVNVHGGGVMGQAQAARTAIAKGIVEFFNDKELKDLYLAYDRSLLVSDPRRKEAKHPRGRGARKKRQKSYR